MAESPAAPAARPGAIDARTARRRFARAAGTYLAATALEAEVGARMLERLAYVKLEVGRVLDAGAGPAREAGALAARYPGAVVLALDASLPLLALARGRRGALARLFGRGGGPLAIGAVMERMPLASGSIDLLWSNMALHWAADADAALREFHRVLRPDGLLMFSTLGPDSLAGLRAAAGAGRVHAFADMHDVGDALVGAGFGAPVMDMERITLTYASPRAFLAELRAGGQSSSLAARPRGLAGRAFRSTLETALARQMRDGRLPVDYEVVYGHAWRPPERPPAGTVTIRLDRLRAKRDR